jgi:phospholipid/cholesterol/gamma-HCH transport system permease protein
MKILRAVGRYFLFLKKVFSIPDQWKMFYKQLLLEFENLGYRSIGIVIIISIFIGAIITIQAQHNTTNPIMPKYTTGLLTRDTVILEFSSTVLCLLLAGKIGSNISSEIGSMRISEQIDALDVIGVNSANYLILPKIIAMVILMPILVVLSMFMGLIGGYFVGIFSHIIIPSNYIYGIQYEFIPFYVTYSLIKSAFFAFIIASISSFYGYYTKGGALDVGRSSTTAVVNSSVLILLFDVILTELMLT